MNHICFLKFDFGDSSRPKPEICFLPGRLGESFCPSSAMAIQWLWIWTPKLPVEKQTLHQWPIAAPVNYMWKSFLFLECLLKVEMQFSNKSTHSYAFHKAQLNIFREKNSQAMGRRS